MKYVISYQGDKVGVGLLDANTAQEDINLAHNLFDIHACNNYYNGVLNFSTQKKFYRFLIHKYIFQFWSSNKRYSQILKKATNKARSVINNDLRYENFLPQIYYYNSFNIGRVYEWYNPSNKNAWTNNGQITNK